MIAEPFRSALESLHAGEAQRGADGALHEIDDTTRIAIDEGLALYSLVVESGFTRTLEVGLAYGFSTAYLLAALDHVGGGRHVAIDPLQHVDWSGIGLTSAQRLVRESSSLEAASFQLIEARSELALADLQRTGFVADLTFIDGYHRFDDVLVDFTLVAHLCPLGGVIVLHDMWLPGIVAVADFITTNRADFTPIATGCDNLFAVRRVGHDERNWDHFVSFG